MLYFICAIAIAINIVFFNILKFNSTILILNVLFFLIIVTFFNKKKKKEFFEKKNLDINYSTELEKKNLEELFLDKIEDIIIVLSKFNIIIYANKAAINNFGSNLEGKHITVGIRISELLDQIDQHRSR